MQRRRRIKPATDPFPPAFPDIEQAGASGLWRGRRRFAVALAFVLLIAGCVLLARSHRFGDLTAFRTELQSVSWLDLVGGVLCIHLGLTVRAVRWARLMRPENRPPASWLVAPQFVGFAAVSLFGRVADLTRPYLVARRTKTPVAMQVGVYSVERALDLGATAVLFSATLLFVPRSAPHHHAFSRAGMLASAATVLLLSFAVLLRVAGHRVAALVRTQLGRVAPKAADSLADRLLELQAGFSTLRSFAQFAAAFACSVLIWLGIAMSYLLTAHSLRASPELTGLGLASVLLVMATSMGTSLLQLPVVGWLTQVATLAAAYHGFFGVPAAAASLCGVLTFTVNTLSVIPVGLIFAHFSGLSLRGAPAPPPDKPLETAG